MKPVKYLRTRPNVCPDLFEVMLFKSDQWIHEQELRLVQSLDKADVHLTWDSDGNPVEQPVPKDEVISTPPFDGLLMWRIPKEMITSITFGHRTPRNKRRKIAEKISLNHELSQVSLFRATRDVSNWDVISVPYDPTLDLHPSQMPGKPNSMSIIRGDDG